MEANSTHSNRKILWEVSRVPDRNRTYPECANKYEWKECLRGTDRAKGINKVCVWHSVGQELGDITVSKTERRWVIMYQKLQWGAWRNCHYGERWVLAWRQQNMEKKVGREETLWLISGSIYPSDSYTLVYSSDIHSSWAWSQLCAFWRQMKGQSFSSPKEERGFAFVGREIQWKARVFRVLSQCLKDKYYTVSLVCSS